MDISSLKHIYKDQIKIDFASNLIKFEQNKEYKKISASQALLDHSESMLLTKLLCKEIGLDKSKTYNPTKSFINKDNYKKINNELNEIGYSYGDENLPFSKISNIKKVISECEFTTKGPYKRQINGVDFFNKKLSDSDLIYGDTFWLKDQNELLKHHAILDLAFDEGILRVAHDYLGAPPILVQAESWLSANSSDNFASINAQAWHQDKEFYKFLKVFFYIDDVTMDNGPHAFVPKSHLREAHNFGLEISARTDDDFIKKHYESDPIYICGKQGSVIFADTSSVHKGSKVKHGQRLILQFEYTTSLYETPLDGFDSHILKSVDDAKKNNFSRSFANFNDKKLKNDSLSIQKIIIKIYFFIKLRIKSILK